MKKLSFYACMLLIATMTYSCATEDKAISEPYTIVELDGYKHKTDLVATFQGQVGEEVILGLGVYDNLDIYGVDFGDGKIVADSVGNQNGGVKDAEGRTKEGTSHTRTTEFKGTVAGDGIVKVYGKSDIWYLTISGNLMPTSFSQEKLANVVQMTISGANVEELALPALPSLTLFSFSNSPIKKLDVSQVPTLTSLSIINTNESKYEPALASIDVSKNPNLESLVIGGEYYMKGILASLDISNNPALTNVVVSNNDVKSITMADKYDKLTLFNTSKNLLTSFDVAKLPAIKSLYLASNLLTTIGDVTKCEALAWFDVKENKLTGDMELKSEKLTNVYVNNNELTSIKVPNVTKQFYFDNNKMTLATLPALPEGMNTSSKKKQFHYQPQADMEVAPNGSVLDLSAQASAKGMEAEAQATVFSITAGNAALVEGKDYTIKGGVITFITDQKEAIVKMTNAGYPNLNLCTKPFDVKGTGEAVVEGTVIFSFFEGAFTGGTAVGNGADEGKVGNEITVSSKKANIETDNITITLDEALKEGDVIKITGYRKKDTDANGNLYILFETGEVIDEGNEVKWNNVHEKVGQQPNTNSYDVNGKAAGSKVIKLARSKASTNVFIQKIEIIRK